MSIEIKTKFWNKLIEDDVQCVLCPRNCIIKNNNSGYCGVRQNDGGVLALSCYGYPAALNVDPIEKKPFAMFMQGTKTFSIGCHGCNLNCSFCQNYHISRTIPLKNFSVKSRILTPLELVEKAISKGCESIALTYNEPTVWAEYGIDIAIEAKKNNLPVVLVSNGYINEISAIEFYRHIDAANIDMKGFSESFYKEMTNGRLEPVLDSIKLIHSMDKHIELTNLVIPNKNDSDDMIENYLKWVSNNLGYETPLHFSAYFPCYKYLISPPTPSKTLYHIKEIALSYGFKNVFLGNLR